MDHAIGGITAQAEAFFGVFRDFCKLAAEQNAENARLTAELRALRDREQLRPEQPQTAWEGPPQSTSNSPSPRRTSGRPLSGQVNRVLLQAQQVFQKAPPRKSVARRSQHRPKFMVEADRKSQAQEEQPFDEALPVLPGQVHRAVDDMESLPQQVDAEKMTCVRTYVEAETAQRMDKRVRTKEFRRLQRILQIERPVSSRIEDEIVDATTLNRGLRMRNPELGLSTQDVDDVAVAIHDLASGPCGSDGGSDMEPLEADAFSLGALVDIMWMPNLQAFVPAAIWEDLDTVVQELRARKVDEIIEEAAHGASPTSEVSPSETTRSFVWYLKAWVSLMVALDLFTSAISMDREPDHIGWFIVGVLCSASYLFDVCYSVYVHGVVGYLVITPERYWNITDSAITLISIVEVIVQACSLGNEKPEGGDGVQYSTRFTVLLRALRVVRVVRLIKLVRSPIMRDLANMLVGFVVGIPSLLWVLFIWVWILALFGMLARVFLGPPIGSDPTHWMKHCGKRGDDVETITDPDCPLHILYGEEFFGTVGTSMFTCFRWMLADYSTRGGVSLAVTFSQEYGSTFMIGYVAWMIVVIFGIFNIVTAIFVDTTTAGLKHNDVKRKHEQQYEIDFFKSKLTQFIDRILSVSETLGLDLKTRAFDKQVFVTESQFSVLMDDHSIRSILLDLEFEVVNLPAVFSTFDVEGRGSISLEELVEGIMRLRGESQKLDVIECLVATRLLHDKVDKMGNLMNAVLAQAADNLISKVDLEAIQKMQSSDGPRGRIPALSMASAGSV